MARTAAGSTLPAGGAERMRTDAHGGSVRENPMWVIGLGATHGLNGLFPFFAERRGWMVVRRPLSPLCNLRPRSTTEKNTHRTPCTSCVCPETDAGQGLPANGHPARHRASPSALRAGPEPAPPGLPALAPNAAAGDPSRLAWATICPRPSPNHGPTPPAPLRRGVGTDLIN